MTTSITVEDGTIVDSANSYVSTADAIAYALKRGVTIPNVADAADVYIYKAMDFLETLYYSGCPTTSVNALEYPIEQELAWPRDYVYIDGIIFDKDTIPQILINAQCELVMALYAGNDPQATITSSDGVKRKKFDVFEVEYKDNSPISVVLPKVNAWLAPLLVSGGGAMHFTTQRSFG